MAYYDSPAETELRRRAATHLPADHVDFWITGLDRSTRLVRVEGSPAGIALLKALVDAGIDAGAGLGLVVAPTEMLEEVEG